MTEKQFGQIINDVAEGAAKKIEDYVEEKVERKGVWLFTRLLSFVTSLGLIAGAGFLRNKDYYVAAKVCLIIGMVSLAFEVFRIIVFKRE